MATKTITLGSSGQNQGTSSTTVLSAPGANAKYKITKFTLDWNNNGAYIYDSGSKKTILKLTSGSTTITIGSFSRSADGARPTISWSGSVLCPANKSLVYQTDCSSGAAGLRNAYKITVTYTTLSRPTVTEGSLITKTQMDALKTWAGKGTTVSVGGAITATIGNSYRSSSVSAGDKIQDTWYNNCP